MTLQPPLKVKNDQFQEINIDIPKSENKVSSLPKKIEESKTISVPNSQTQKVVEKTFDDFYEENTEPYDSNGNIYITDLSVVDDKVIAHGDILIGNKDDLQSAQNANRPMIMAPPELWENGVIPYSIDPNLDYNVKEIAIYVMEELSSLSNVTFSERVSEKDYISFEPSPVHCFTYVGRIGGKQEVFLSPGCGRKQITHELMHTLGFHHEQSRMDRDKHLQILWENIEKKFHSQFRKVPWKHLDIEKFPFDYNSVMLYSPTAFSIDGESYSIIKSNGEPYPPAEGISLQDIDRINSLYPVEAED